MSQLTQRTIFSAGLATLALALAPAAQAQIQVTGGVIDGEAAFFRATTGNTPISLFDINITNMQIVSPNGVLTNPDFIPTAAGGFVDNPNGTADNVVSAGDTGLLVGKLSGIGFDSGGAIVPFSNVTTALAYQVSRFDVNAASSFTGGFLVDGDSIPQLFFTADPGTLASGFTKTAGDLDVGDFNSNITAGIIDLPSTLELSSTGSFGSVFNLTASDENVGTGSASRAFTDSDDEVDDTFSDTNDDNTAVNIAFNFNTTNVTFSNTQTFTVNGSTSFTTSSSTSLSDVKTLIEAVLDDLDVEALGNTATLAIFTGGGDSDTVRYEVTNGPTYKVRVRRNRRGDIKIKIRVKNRRGRRYFLAVRGGDLVGGFKQCGPASRVFSGLVGLETLSDEEAAELYAELQADEAAESGDDVADGDDDGDDDVADGDDDGDDDVADGDDDGDDDVADGDDDGDDDGEDVADGDDDSDGAAFQGLDSTDATTPEEAIAPAEGTEPAAEEAPVEEPAAEETPVEVPSGFSGLESIDATTPEEAIAQ